MEQNKVRQASFNLGRIRQSGAMSEDLSVKKSSYMCPAALQQRMKMLSASRRVTLNELIIEAFNDLLSKYGQ